MKSENYKVFEAEFLYDSGFCIVYILEFVFIVWISNSIMQEVITFLKLSGNF